MKVFCRKPERHSTLSSDFIFPSKSFVPVRSFQYHEDERYLEITSLHNAENIRILQVEILSGLFELVLAALETMEAEGRVIVFYHGQEIKYARTVRKRRDLFLMPAIFSFGFRACHEYGESEVWIWVTKNFGILAECSGRGIGYEVMKRVAKIFKPKPINVRLCSKWDRLAGIACGENKVDAYMTRADICLPPCMKKDFPEVYPNASFSEIGTVANDLEKKEVE